MPVDFYASGHYHATDARRHDGPMNTRGRRLNTYQSSLGSLLREARHKKKHNQGQAAEVFGVNQSTESKWEKGAKIGDEHIDTVAKYIGIPPEDALLLAYGRSASGSSDSSKPTGRAVGGVGRAAAVAAEGVAARDLTSDMIAYPFPLRDGMLVALHLPPDLTKKEAMRMAAFIDSLAVG